MQLKGEEGEEEDSRRGGGGEMSAARASERRGRPPKPIPFSLSFAVEEDNNKSVVGIVVILTAVTPSREKFPSSWNMQINLFFLLPLQYRIIRRRPRGRGVRMTVNPLDLFPGCTEPANTANAIRTR